MKQTVDFDHTYDAMDVIMAELESRTEWKDLSEEEKEMMIEEYLLW